VHEAQLALAIAVRVAFRHFDDAGTSDKERDAILRAMCNVLDGQEAEMASRVLHHRTEARALQLELAGIVQGKAER
jgi:hypothetical protein